MREGIVVEEASTSSNEQADDTAYRKCINDARCICPPETLVALKQPQPGSTVAWTTVLWVQMIGAWFVALFAAHPIWILSSFVVLCSTIPAMQTWVHEASHGKLFKRRVLNDWWGDLFFAGPIGMSVVTYRRYHMAHHAYLSTGQDPDRWAYDVDIRGRHRLLRVLLRSLSGYDGIRIALSKYLSPNHDREKGIYRAMVISVISNTFLLIICFAAGRWYLYFLLWLYPILAVAVTINYVRSIAEHQPPDFTPRAASTGASIPPLARTTCPFFLEKWFMYQANFNYHLEHHLFPSIPFCHLPKLHQRLRTAGFYDLHPHCLQHSGIAQVIRLSRPLAKNPEIEGGIS